MQKTYWYGSDKDNQVQFSENKNVLNNAGIDNPQSFTVNGTVEGLRLIDQQQTSQSGSGQAAHG